MYKNVICSAPFTALHIASNLTGVKVFPCCLYDTRQGIPFDDNKSVNEVFNQLYDIRQLFIDSHTDISNLKYCRSECIDNFPESQLKQHNNTAKPQTHTTANNKRNSNQQHTQHKPAQSQTTIETQQTQTTP